jgi:hypothetical protein
MRTKLGLRVWHSRSLGKAASLELPGKIPGVDRLTVGRPSLPAVATSQMRTSGQCGCQSGRLSADVQANE